MHTSRNPIPSPARGFGERDPEQVGLGELAPRREVVPILGTVALLQVLERHPVAEDLRREPGQFLLLFSE
jgi:hypothetical protein